MLKKIILVLIIALIALQFVPVDRSNPPVRGDFDGPAEVREILVRSCYDCHSNETRWPWYSRIAPFSFMIADHVEEGRHELNFSEWRAYDQRMRAHKAGEIIEVVEKGEMPMPGYVLLHGEAKLTGNEIQTLRDWNP
jgi:hypothetical protein